MVFDGDEAWRLLDFKAMLDWNDGAATLPGSLLGLTNTREGARFRVGPSREFLPEEKART
jgi:hypothetical protein